MRCKSLIFVIMQIDKYPFLKPDEPIQRLFKGAGAVLNKMEKVIGPLTILVRYSR